ncbi:hypothetical protein GCM10023321_11860 [Pseudonocardia eucalypti]|uniref:Mce-associated membrane protein n=1 Tax=Pseudonocardia eucalypti TaxID=648755 RepID=A0ABP9PM24_9PSEU|nr:Mce-associated membrane protein [Pseudonocardia eucalypti]
MIRALGRLAGAVVTGADRALPPGLPRVLLAAATALLAVGGAVGLTVLTFSTADALRGESAGRQAVSAALDLTPKLLNFDYRTLDTDLERARSAATGDYWARSALAETIRPVVVEQRASMRTVVREAGVAEAGPDRVVVLLFLNQTTSGKNLIAPRVDSRVARVTAVRVDGRWLLAGFEPV